MNTGFLFSGQGAQAVGMGQSFYQASPVARALYDRANATLGMSLTDVCFNGPAEALTQTSVCQPALYVHGYVAYTLLRQAQPGLQPGAALGLSLGELTALSAAGVFDFETGLRIVAERGRLMQMACEQSQGTMASIIGGTREQVAQLCQQFDIDMANLNCPGQIVISGEQLKVKAAMVTGATMGFKKIIPLNVAGAYHSRLMQPAADAFEAFLAPIAFNAPAFPVFSNTTGAQVTTPDQIKAALVRQVVSSVLWEDCMQGAIALGVTHFYECGMGGVLTGLAKRIDPNARVTAIATIQDLQPAEATV